MTDHLNIPYRLRDAVAEAEQHASDVMRHAGHCPLPWEHKHWQWWVDTFGASEQEFEEMASALARTYHRTRPWRRKERKRIMSDYIRVHAILYSGKGLESVWRC